VNLQALAWELTERARSRLDDARRAVEDGRWADVLRFSQEAVELALKGLLRGIAVEVPKRHDVGPVLAEVAPQLPAAVRRELPELTELSAQLAERRSLAVYGDEAGGRTASEIFQSREEAESYLRRAGRAVRLARGSLRPSHGRRGRR
jgi:HEPN domain-containing protein